MCVARHPTLLGVAGVALVTACASNTAPAGFLPKPDQLQTDAYGGWIELRYLQEGRELRRAGELIAVSKDSVWVLEQAGGVVLATSAVRTGKLTAYTSGVGKVATFTFLGVLSTVSNGVVPILTAPLWIITGTVAGVTESHAPERKTPPLGWPDLATFARFPAGMPTGVKLEDLHPPTSRR